MSKPVHRGGSKPRVVVTVSRVGEKEFLKQRLFMLMESQTP